MSHHCNDYENNNYFLDFQSTSLPASVDRCSEDSVLNNYGKLLLNLCTAFDLRILNGMCYGDRHGCYTYVSNSGSSVNDYFLMSCELYSSLCESCELKIGERIDSDHMPVQFFFNCFDVCHKILEETVTLEKFVWNEVYADMIGNTFWSKDFEDKMSLAISLISIDINEAINKFNMCLTDAATCMKKRVYVNKKRVSQDWFDYECKNFRRKARSLLKRYRRMLNDNDRDQYCKARREYKHLLNRKRKNFNNALLDELVASITSQKQFWDTVHKITRKKKQPINDITVDAWFNHFKELLTKDVDTNTVLQHEEMEGKIDNLNRPISKEEVILAINKIKTRKAPGPDGIIGEILKYSSKSDLVLNFLITFLIHCLIKVFIRKIGLSLLFFLYTRKVMLIIQTTTEVFHSQMLAVKYTVL